MPTTIMFMSIVVVRRLVPKIGIRPFLTVGPILAIAAMVSFSQLDARQQLLAVPRLASCCSASAWAAASCR